MGTMRSMFTFFRAQSWPTPRSPAGPAAPTPSPSAADPTCCTPTIAARFGSGCEGRLLGRQHMLAWSIRALGAPRAGAMSEALSRIPRSPCHPPRPYLETGPTQPTNQPSSSHSHPTHGTPHRLPSGHAGVHEVFHVLRSRFRLVRGEPVRPRPKKGGVDGRSARPGRKFSRSRII